MPAANLILIGYRGCGKSSAGRILAARLGWPFIDTDEQIVARAGRSIREIFETDGEAAFRALETAVIADITGRVGQVMSVGGGAVLSVENRAALRAAGTCIWLTAPTEELWRRLAADPQTAATRPTLTDQGGLAEVRHLLAERTPLYAALASRVVDTAGRSAADVADEILAQVTTTPGPSEAGR